MAAVLLYRVSLIRSPSCDFFTNDEKFFRAPAAWIRLIVFSNFDRPCRPSRGGFVHIQDARRRTPHPGPLPAARGEGTREGDLIRSDLPLPVRRGPPGEHLCFGSSSF